MITFIDHDGTDPALNLALEETFFRRARERRESFVSLWRSEPSVVIGRFQNAAAQVNRTFLKRRGMPLLRRITGGGAVYHDLGNLNYTVILFGTRRDAFDFTRMIRPLLDHLHRLGLPAATNDRNDITLGELKCSGCAQHFTADTLLHHGTLLYDTDLNDLREALRSTPERYTSKAIDSVPSPITNISPHLLTPPSLDGFRRLLAEKLANCWNARRRTPMADELADARRLVAERYSRWEWNWGASPDFEVRLFRRFGQEELKAALRIEAGRIVASHLEGTAGTPHQRNALANWLVGHRYPLEEPVVPPSLGDIPIDRLTNFFAN